MKLRKILATKKYSYTVADIQDPKYPFWKRRKIAVAITLFLTW